MDIAYLKFWIKAANSKGHGTHSPFVYDFIVNVLNDERVFYSFKELISQRRKLRNTQLLNPQKIDELLFRMVDYYAIQSIATINASEITEKYFVKSNADLKYTKLNTLSGVSNSNFNAIYIDVNDNVVGNLSSLLALCSPKSFILVNKNHKNPAQEKLWNDLMNDSRINTTIDLYHLGIAVINNDFKVKQHFNIRY